MVRSAIPRSLRPTLIAMALSTAGCGDGDRLPALEPLPRTQHDDALQEPAPQAPEPAQAEPTTPEALAPDPDAQPDVGLRLSLPSEAAVDVVTYTIERDGTTLAEAVIPIMGEQVVGIQLGNLPPGDGYTLHLVVEREGLPACEGSTMLAIVEGRTTAVSLTLECPGIPGTLALQPSARQGG